MSFSQTIPHENSTLQLIVEFGQAGDSIDKIQSKYPRSDLSLLTQTHGDQLIQTHSINSKDYSRKADAQFTLDHNVLLGIKTADCMPVLAYHPRGIVAAFHAGWRGVQNQIVPQGLRELQTKYDLKNSLWKIWIGPHIQMESFEVDRALGVSFLKQGESAGLSASDDWIIFKENKAYVRLAKILSAELKNLDIEPVHTSKRDTVTDFELHSYRREKEKGGRQISIIGFQK